VIYYNPSAVALWDAFIDVIRTTVDGATENARPDIARLDKTAPHRKGGHRETCFIVQVDNDIVLDFCNFSKFSLPSDLLATRCASFSNR